MNVLIIGTRAHLDEATLKFSDAQLVHAQDHASANEVVQACDVVFDFIIGQNPGQLRNYPVGKPIFLNSVMTTLKSICSDCDDRGIFFGFNGMPTFFDREILEVSLLKESHQAQLQATCQALKTGWRIVKDSVGMVTPRVICMIINEAYFTLEEGTAAREDIDLAMKLGTAYPYGPFEWCQRIGIKNVQHLLAAVFNDTREERYKICPLLAAESLVS